MRYDEMPMRKNKTVQTIGKTIDGGEKGGFTRFAQMELLAEVKRPDMISTEKLRSRLKAR